MEYPDNRAKFKHEDATHFAAKSISAKRGAAPRETFRKAGEPEPQVEVVVAPPPPWNAVPDPSDFEI